MIAYSLSPAQSYILNLLLNRVEGSSLLNRAVSLTVNERNFPIYFDDRDPAALKKWEEEVIALQALKWVEIDRGKGAESHRIVRLKLVRANQAEIARAVGRWSLGEWQDEITSLYQLRLDEFRLQPTLYPAGWREYLLRGLERTKRLRPDFEKRASLKSETELLLAALGKIVCPSSRTSYGRGKLTWRQFATWEFGDSKKLNPLKPQVIRALYEITGLSFWQPDPGILNEFGIENKQELLMISGPFTAISAQRSTFKIEGVLWQPFAALPRTMVEEHGFRWDFTASSGILTIENEETFQAWCREPLNSSWVAIYLGGYPSQFKTEFLMSVPRTYPLYHWGDLDVGGIRIFTYLERTLKRNIRPFAMGPELLTKYRTSTQSLETAEVTRMMTLLDELSGNHPLRGLAEAILRLGVKLEQEAVLLRD